MFAFRDAYEKHDSLKEEDVRADGERVLTDRASLRRRSADEAYLKRDLSIDLANLVDTIDLASVIELDGLEYVQKSVLNYGLYDLTHVTLGGDDVARIADWLKSAVLQHEPRISPDTLSVEQVMDEVSDTNSQRVRFKVHAELISRPLDIPIEFVAEIDSSAGKMSIASLPGSA